MKTTLISALALTLGLSGAMPALAFPKAADGAATLTGKALQPMLEMVRRGRGGDDPQPHRVELAKKGADDAAGDDRRGRGRGADDPQPHRSELMAKRGADDPAGDDRGGRGRGADDPAGDDRGGRGRGGRG